jgi:dethiobiotin synthetase
VNRTAIPAGTRVLFVTGTDTGVGKTAVTAALLLSARAWGLKALALKPVAAGGQWRAGRWVNDDAALYQSLCPELTAGDVNPVDLELPLAPHIAAARQGRSLGVGPLVDHVARVASLHRPDLLLVEGAGGWLVPLNDRETLADLAREMKAGVVLVVGLRLGCLNHALLTAAAVRSAGLSLAGWVANTLDPSMVALDENVATLDLALPALRLGVVPWLGSAITPDQVATWLDGSPLWSRA